MRIIKLALISAVVLFGLISLMSSFLPSQVRISRAIDISAGKEQCFAPLANMEAWQQWNEYIKAYHHKKIEKNELESDEIAISFTEKTDSIVRTEWQKPNGNKFGSGFVIISQDAKHTTVQWYFDFHVRWYPWEKFQSIVFDQQFGPVMERSLANLKKMAEAAP